MKNAGLLGLPVLAVTTSGPGRSLRDMRVGRVEDWDDAAMTFLIAFGTILGPIPCVAKARSHTSFEARFRFGAFRRFGYQCAVCDMAVPKLLDVVRPKPRPIKIDDGTENGLVLSALHKTAYEAGLFTIDPFTLHITTPSDGPDMAAPNIAQSDLDHLNYGSDTP